MFGPAEVLSSLNILDKLTKLWKWFTARRNPPAESIASRFVRLFESHGVHRNQIPRFFGRGLTIKDIQDDNALLTKLDDTILASACEMFAVRREWLDGADTQVYEIHDFYTIPEYFTDFITTLKADNSAGDFGGILIAPIETHRNADALLILDEVVGHIGENAIRRYHLCQHPSFSYWKTRAYLTACVAIAWKLDIFIKGFRMPNKGIQRIFHGTSLPFWSSEGIWTLGVKKWYPEDMALKPETFLKEIDPEINNFGIKAALELWLDLDDKGFMDNGIHGSVRNLFKNMLLKHTC